MTSTRKHIQIVLFVMSFIAIFIIGFYIPNNSKLRNLNINAYPKDLISDFAEYKESFENVKNIISNMPNTIYDIKGKYVYNEQPLSLTHDEIKAFTEFNKKTKINNIKKTDHFARYSILSGYCYIYYSTESIKDLAAHDFKYNEHRFFNIADNWYYYVHRDSKYGFKINQ